MFFFGGGGASPGSSVYIPQWKSLSVWSSFAERRVRDDREERDVRKNLPPLLTAGHTEVDGVFSRLYAAASEIQHSAEVRKWRIRVFLPIWITVWAETETGVDEQDAQPDSSARFWGKLREFDSDFRNYFIWSWMMPKIECASFYFLCTSSYSHSCVTE